MSLFDGQPPCPVCGHAEHRRNGRIAKCRDCRTPTGIACSAPTKTNGRRELFIDEAVP